MFHSHRVFCRSGPSFVFALEILQLGRRSPTDEHAEEVPSTSPASHCIHESTTKEQFKRSIGSNRILLVYCATLLTRATLEPIDFQTSSNFSGMKHPTFLFPSPINGISCVLRTSRRSESTTTLAGDSAVIILLLNITDSWKQ